MSFENLLLILALLAIAFVNVVLPWLRRQAEAARRGQPEPEREPADGGLADKGNRNPAVPGAPAPPVQAPAAVRLEHPERSRRAHAPAAHGTRATNRRALHAAPSSLAEVRRGIVLRTILGPCRAQDPLELR